MRSSHRTSARPARTQWAEPRTSGAARHYRDAVPDSRATPTGVEDLADLLEVPPDEVSFLGRLDEADLARLHDVVAGSLEREAQAIDEALEATMRFLPRPLRGRARKMLFPGE